MFTGPEIENTLAAMGITHVVWVPDTSIGPWEDSLATSSRLRLIRICREGEAWPLAAGLFLGGKLPLVVMQTTGLYESGDALRNVCFDLKLPIYAMIGVRNWTVPHSRDSAKTFAEPIVRAWTVDTQWIACAEDKPRLAEHFRHCQSSEIPGVSLLAEGAP